MNNIFILRCSNYQTSIRQRSSRKMSTSLSICPTGYPFAWRLINLYRLTFHRVYISIINRRWLIVDRFLLFSFSTGILQVVKQSRKSDCHSGYCIINDRTFIMNYRVYRNSSNLCVQSIRCFSTFPSDFEEKGWNHHWSHL